MHGYMEIIIMSPFLPWLLHYKRKHAWAYSLPIIVIGSTYLQIIEAIVIRAGNNVEFIFESMERRFDMNFTDDVGQTLLNSL